MLKNVSMKPIKATPRIVGFTDLVGLRDQSKNLLSMVDERTGRMEGKIEDVSKTVRTQ